MPDISEVARRDTIFEGREMHSSPNEKYCIIDGGTLEYVNAVEGELYVCEKCSCPYNLKLSDLSMNNDAIRYMKELTKRREKLEHDLSSTPGRVATIDKILESGKLRGLY